MVYPMVRDRVYLHEMVLHNVADDAVLVEVARAAGDADGLLQGGRARARVRNRVRATPMASLKGVGARGRDRDRVGVGVRARVRVRVGVGVGVRVRGCYLEGDAHVGDVIGVKEPAQLPVGDIGEI